MEYRMHDLISRKWLMECIDEGWIKFDSEKDTNLYIHLVRDIAPSVQPYTDEEIQKMQDIEQAQLDKAYEMGNADALRWIPCSERLPEESGTYTVTAYDGATNRVTYAKYQKRLKRWELTGARAYWRVVAWMPLPESYRG